MGQKIKVSIPTYVKGFKCIGGACEDSCCIGWDIDIDKITYRHYFRTKNEAMKAEFKRHIYKNEACDSEDVDYGRVKIRENTWCPFLNQEKLCDIYTQLGEEHLSNVCTSYPRVINSVDNVLEMSLFMSCPEAARQLLADDAPIVWEQETIELTKYIIHSQVNTQDSTWNKSPIKYMKELRKLSIDYLQDRETPLDQRLVGLGYRLETLSAQFQESLKKKNKSSWPSSPLRYETNNVEFKRATNVLLEFGFLKELLQEIGSSEQVDSPLFLKSVEKVNLLFHINETTTLKEQAERYQVVKKKASSYESKLDPILEKYLINFMFQGNFPFTENQSVFDGYVMLAVRYVFLRFLLHGQIDLCEFNREVVIRYIQLFTKTIEHHRSFIGNVLVNMQIQEFNQMNVLHAILSNGSDKET